VPVERHSGGMARAYAQEKLEWQVAPDAVRVREVLARSVDVVSFCLRESDADGMGWLSP
jgi:hypothetical protein